MPKNSYTDANISPELADKLKSCDPEIRHFVDELIAENLKLHRRLAKLETERLSESNRIEAESEMTNEEAIDRLVSLLASAASRYEASRNRSDNLGESK